MTSIYGDSAVIRRIEARSSFQNVTSNGTLAASVMVIAALVAVALANSSVFEGLHELMEAPLLLGVGSLSVSITFEAFVNDFLMAIFFLCSWASSSSTSSPWASFAGRARRLCPCSRPWVACSRPPSSTSPSIAAAPCTGGRRPLRPTSPSRSGDVSSGGAHLV